MNPISNCFACDSEAIELVRDRVDFAIGRRSTPVVVERFRCGNCGESFYTPTQAHAAQLAAANEMRRQDNLLLPTEIVAIRKKYRFTQAQLEQLLGVGPKTVVRWEGGTVFQSRAIDDLLRVLDEFPQAVDFLAKRHQLEVVASVAELSATDIQDWDDGVQFKHRATTTHASSHFTIRAEAIAESPIRSRSTVISIPDEALV
jgi:HTH-type transcriptional regulator/antitoxin MqsA